MSGEFSLVLGGPLYQLFRRTRLTGDALELLRRRIFVLTLLPVLPLTLTMISLEELLGRLLKMVF
jgi:hypothetical protein